MEGVWWAYVVENKWCMRLRSDVTRVLRAALGAAGWQGADFTGAGGFRVLLDSGCVFVRPLRIWSAVVLTYRALMQPARRHPACLGSVERWYRVADAAGWRHLMDVRQTFRHADQIGSTLVFDIVFDIGGNHFRLMCCVDYGARQLIFRALLSHAEYDRTNVRELCP